MNMHDATTADRTLLPRGLVPRPEAQATPLNMRKGSYVPPVGLPQKVEVRRFKFRIGAYVRFHDFTALVTGRSATWLGKQNFAIEIVGEAYGRPQRTVRGEYLRRCVRKSPSLPPL